jgi:hypothetical protein
MLQYNILYEQAACLNPFLFPGEILRRSPRAVPVVRPYPSNWATSSQNWPPSSRTKNPPERRGALADDTFSSEKTCLSRQSNYIMILLLFCAEKLIVSYARGIL